MESNISRPTIASWVGSALHTHWSRGRFSEAPDLPAVYVPHLTEPLTEGLVLTIEPIIAAGKGMVREAGDGWTYRTSDGTLSAHAEHIMVITAGEPIVLTAD